MFTNTYRQKLFTLFFCVIFLQIALTQNTISGKIFAKDSILFSFCKIGIKGSSIVTTPNGNGTFQLKNIPNVKAVLQCYCDDFEGKTVNIDFKDKKEIFLEIELVKKIAEINEVEVLGNIKETNRADSPIITDIYDKKYFQKNPSASLIDVLDRMNGVRPQVNCNVCGTGDIHLNGLEGAYTLIVLDGVPIVGGLSSVYGLSGIPSFMLDRIEVTKGPASSLYGSEAVAGVIHAFSKKTSKKTALYVQNFTTSHLENNLDLGINLKVAKKWRVFTTGNFYYFNQKIDANNDNFTDIPLQNRYSIYQKWNLDRKENRMFQISARYLNEKRWGGEKNWNRSFRGSDSIYAETIDLNRAEVNLIYQLPLKEKLLFIAHYNFHDQDSYYGTTKFAAIQQLQFYQLTWDKKFNKHQFLSGLTFRQTTYDDNTFLTQSSDSIPKNKALNTSLPSVFLQDQIKFTEKSLLLLSTRLDYYDAHGFIFTPRIAFSQKLFKNGTFRLHAGTGFRVVNLFTEDHASLTGSREIIVLEDLKPERSYSFNSAYSVLKSLNENWKMELDIQVFYTYFTNRIVPDYLSNPNAIIYANINGFGQSYGTGLDLKLISEKGISLQLGATLMDVSLYENGGKQAQLLTEKWSGNWTISYQFQKLPLSVDYTGNVTSAMSLPVLNELDPRPLTSKPYSIQNLQLSYAFSSNKILFIGVKNLLNWTPAKGIPFLIARANDPFDKEVLTNPDGSVIATNNNPYALTFDPAYVYAPNQGIRFFFGFRFSFD